MGLKKQKTDEIRKQLDEIIVKIEHQSKKGLKLHEVEVSLFRSLLKLGLDLLRYYIFLVNVTLGLQAPPRDSSGNEMRNKGNLSSPYFSVFGRIEIERTKYYSTIDKSYYALDAVLGIAKDRYSYILKDWMGYGSVEMDFDESVKQLERILGHRLWGMQSRRQTSSLSKKVEQYYKYANWEGKDEGTHFSVGYDGKGVPIIRSETGRCKESVSTRLSKGQKRGVKKEATVSVSSSFTVKKRRADDILEALFNSPEKTEGVRDSAQKHQWHEQKHIRAFLSDKSKAIEYGIDNILKRDPTHRKPIIVLIDGDRALEKAVLKVVETKKIAHRVQAYILDFIHLLEYVWKVANAKLGENHPERENWVKSQAELLLGSQTEQVLKEWEEIADNKELKTTHQYNLKRAITYLTNHQHMVDYKTYLQNGYPITTGAVESACGHFVKSRMERNAMHWSKKGAQEMLNIRAVKKNGEWDDYVEKFIKQELEELYPKAA
jgi:hypothetical protein